jgi:hypothetical protein
MRVSVPDALRGPAGNLAGLSLLPIRTKGHSGGARGFVISGSKIVGDCD